MTEWTSESSVATSWNSGTGQNTGSTVLYNSALAYNLDYITYNGYYVENETDWTSSSAVETSWVES